MSGNLTGLRSWTKLGSQDIGMTNPLNVLIVEDSVDDTFFIVRELQRGGFNVNFERVETSAAMETALEARPWDLVISDFSMPLFGGAAALALYRQTGLDVPFILVSGTMGEEIAVEMLKSGAHHYVMKDNLSKLVFAVNRELKSYQERRIRQQTEATQAYLASIVSSCNDAIIGKTLDGTVVSWNEGAQKLYGYSASEMIGQSISLLCPHYRPEELPEIMERIASGEQVEKLETVRLRKDRTPVEVSVVISPIKDTGGKVVGASSVSRDISQRRQEENERLALIQELTAALAHTRS
jgi:PAS domain S-box-containing protein